MLTPSDIRNRMLKTTMGGYNKRIQMIFWILCTKVLKSFIKKIRI